MNVKGTKKKNQVVTANIFEQQELLKKAEVIRESLTASTWHELETNGKFDKNKKLSFVGDDMLILGCDVGSETHYMRAIDTRGRELSKSAFSFNNDSEGFLSAKEWAVRHPYKWKTGGAVFMMDYEMFRDVFREKLMSHMPDELAGYSLRADRTGKVNETLDALHLVPPDCLPDKLYPTVYLNHVYEEYKKSGDLQGCWTAN